MSRNFFYILLALSFVFATLSALIYLKRLQMLSLHGIKHKWKYLSVLYSTTIGINVLLFLFIFPVVANIATAGESGNVANNNILSNLTLKVDIPCPGHAPLISGELQTINGVNSVQFRFPNYFDVSYDSAITSKDKILGLGIFIEYPAFVVNDTPQDTPRNSPQTAAPVGCSGCGGCSGSCGG
jgi:hypothetical protein